jgi:5-methylcytosine-specific restriction endonuclease McrA
MGSDLHHVLPRSNPFPDLWDESNLVLLCPNCHLKVGQYFEWRVKILHKLSELYDYDFNAEVYRPYIY